eukprot:NODE_29_length_33183_cov_0.333666.p12 type:complete len:242 gc:universal NODE_29_length_33183_cov_0.333666:20327-21052(+)
MEKETISISGIEIDVFCKSKTQEASIGMFLLHGRTRNKKDLEFLAKGIVECNSILVFSFDLRNHGSRLVNTLQNEDWVGGNPNHHLDMWSILMGTVEDCVLLMNLLPIYGYKIGAWGICGVSLGGHASLILAGCDKRVKYAISLIGCIDFLGLMEGRKPNEIEFSSSYISLTSKHNAVNNLRENKANILMLNGAQDELVPGSVNKNHFTIPNLTYKEFDVGHKINTEMLNEVYQFLRDAQC